MISFRHDPGDIGGVSEPTLAKNMATTSWSRPESWVPQPILKPIVTVGRPSAQCPIRIANRPGSTGGIGFNITGVPLAEDSALIDAGLDFTLGTNMSAALSSSGQFGDGVQDNAVKGRFTWLF